jgi:hypothetical protein
VPRARARAAAAAQGRAQHAPDNLFQVLVTSDKLAPADAQGYDLVLALTKGALGLAVLRRRAVRSARGERMLGHFETCCAARWRDRTRRSASSRS